jgi:hypothetical protein
VFETVQVAENVSEQAASDLVVQFLGRDVHLSGPQNQLGGEEHQ